jgi:hypothetical protein
VATATFARLDQVNTVISSLNAPESLVCQVRAHGVEVVLI